MSNTLTVTQRVTNNSNGLENRTLIIKETRSGLQENSTVLLERSSFVSDPGFEHVLEKLAPQHRMCLVKQPPHASSTSTQTTRYGSITKMQLEERSSGAMWSVSDFCVFNEINRLRTSPHLFLEELECRRREVVGSTLWGAHGAMRLTEGVSVLDEAIEVMRDYCCAFESRVASGSPPVTPQLCEGLCLAAQDLALDIGPKGLLTQRGTDESAVSDRVSRYGVWIDVVSEIAVFGVRDPVDLVCHILMNDGVASRIHRHQLLDADKLPCVGVCLSPHLTAGFAVVITFAGGFVPKTTDDMNRSRPSSGVLDSPTPVCAYCYGEVDLRRCVYGVGGRPFHKSCFMCKVCKSTLRQQYFEIDFAGKVEALCTDCVQFRHGAKCSSCRKAIVFAKETYRKDNQPLCEHCFLDEARHLTEGYTHDGVGQFQQS